MQLLRSFTFDLMQKDDFEEIVFFQDKGTGLKAIVAIHNTLLGPALGGTRFWQYETELDALKDAMRLAKAMTMKAAAAGLNLGGGKAVIIGNPKQKSEALLRAYGRFVQSLGGRYVTAEDVGTTLEDIRIIAEETRFVTGVKLDPSPFTAYGVFHGIKACLEHVFGDGSLDGVRIAVQGLGKVGGELVRLLVKAGAEVTATDIDAERAGFFKNELGIEVVEPNEIFAVKCDVFSPCALGGVINDATIKKLTCKIVAGGANNQLEAEKHGNILAKKGILYAPDYVINAGGLIAVGREYEGITDEGRIKEEVEKIGDRLKRIFQMREEMAKSKVYSTAKAADAFALERIERIRSLKKIYQPLS
ncbi:MAG: Glu/Leu/Phe/Val dehydrogenase [Archaeoglobus sp.]|nr:Glu/Leu/Phe/Val dehydrogenase [Archaeoglobus sp.]